MSSYLSLTKAFIKSLSMSKSTGIKKILFNILIYIVGLLIFLPFLLFIGLCTYSMTSSLLEVGYESIGLQIVCIILCLFIFIFSFNVLLDELYFNDNVEKLLPLPLKPFQIVAAKFTSCYIAENLISLFMIGAGVVGYLLCIGFNIKNLLLSLICIITIPIIPMIYSGIISLLIMHFTRFIKNKETVRKLGMSFVFIILFIVVFSFSKIKSFNLDLYIENFVNGEHTLYNIFNFIFPHIELFINVLNKGTISSLILYLLINIVFIWAFLKISNYLYLNGVKELREKDNEKKSNSINLINNIKSHSILSSLLNKEIKILFRTPSYFINCIIINIIWPIFVYVIILFLGLDFKNIEFTNNNLIIIITFIVGISLIVPSISTIASSSFSREGKHYEFIKYIPVDKKTIWLSKVLVSFIISFIGINIFTTIFYIYIGLDIRVGLYLYLLSFLIILSVSLLGTLIDSIQPKLVWDDELNALRENWNTFVVMGINLLLVGVLSLFIYKSFYLDYKYIYSIIIILFTIINIIILILSKLFISNNLNNQEEM